MPMIAVLQLPPVGLVVHNHHGVVGLSMDTCNSMHGKAKPAVPATRKAHQTTVVYNIVEDSLQGLKRQVEGLNYMSIAAPLVQWSATACQLMPERLHVAFTSCITQESAEDCLPGSACYGSSGHDEPDTSMLLRQVAVRRVPILRLHMLTHTLGSILGGHRGRFN